VQTFTPLLSKAMALAHQKASAEVAALRKPGADIDEEKEEQLLQTRTCLHAREFVSALCQRTLCICF
jgi:hypothetical protein